MELDQWNENRDFYWEKLKFYNQSVIFYFLKFVFNCLHRNLYWALGLEKVNQEEKPPKTELSKENYTQS